MKPVLLSGLVGEVQSVTQQQWLRLEEGVPPDDILDSDVKYARSPDGFIMRVYRNKPPVFLGKLVG